MTTATRLLAIFSLLLLLLVVSAIYFWKEKEVKALQDEIHSLQTQLKQVPATEKYRKAINRLERELQETRKRFSQTKISQQEQRNRLLQEVQSLQKQLREIQQKYIETQRKLLSLNYPEKEIFIIYGHSSFPPYYEYYRCLPVDRNIPLQRKLQILADSLSFHQFKSLPIEIQQIDTTTNHRLIAIVNLKEFTTAHQPVISWKGNFFQGSTGGASTTAVLLHTFLQPDFNGEWIDGVQFLYQGSPISPHVWDHIEGLSQVRYRTEIN